VAVDQAKEGVGGFRERRANRWIKNAKMCEKTFFVFDETSRFFSRK